MAQEMIAQSKKTDSGFYLEDLKGLKATLLKLENAKQAHMLMESSRHIGKILLTTGQK